MSPVVHIQLQGAGLLPRGPVEFIARYESDRIDLEPHERASVDYSGLSALAYDVIVPYQFDLALGLAKLTSLRNTNPGLTFLATNLRSDSKSSGDFVDWCVRACVLKCISIDTRMHTCAGMRVLKCISIDTRMQNTIMQQTYLALVFFSRPLSKAVELRAGRRSLA